MSNEVKVDVGMEVLAVASQDLEDELVSEEDDEEDEESNIYRGNILKSPADKSVDESETSMSLDSLRNESPASNRYSIMAEPLMEEEENNGDYKSELKQGSHENITPEIQEKRLSIRMNMKPSANHMRCIFIRESGSISSKLFYPNYYMYLDDGSGNQLLIAAKKCTRNKSASYYMFDMSLEKDVSKCTRESTNIIGKIVKMNNEATHLVLQRDADEFGGIVFFKPHVGDLFAISTPHPRNIQALIPPLDEMGNTIPHEVKTGTKSMVDLISDDDKCHNYIQLRSKDPIFYNGCYRLHFLGRVPVVPSVKNFQVNIHYTSYSNVSSIHTRISISNAPQCLLRS
jgi:hypothetical protein